MNILVLNGSPKGKYSITLQTVKYLRKLHPEHSYKVIHVGQCIKKLENDFSAAGELLRKADLLLFSYPVYTFIAPSQLHRFIELLKESGLSLEGKFATQITTSKHFYDVTAHNYIQENCQDMGMRFINGLSADMDDLLTKKGQKEAQDFFDFVIWSIKTENYEPVRQPVCESRHMPVEIPEHDNADKTGDVVIVTDCAENDIQLKSMIERFQAVLPIKTRIVNIREYPFRGGCLGCFNCAASGKCIYVDGFDEFLRGDIQTAQAIVYAFSIRDHSMGAIFKLYDDRQFCNGHRTVTMGMPMGYLVSGNYHMEKNLQMIIEGRAQVGGNFLAGVATDESDPNREIDKIAEKLSYALEHEYIPPRNFYGIGGMKIFRDLIWLMQGMMKADHKFYREHGQYDFPQKQCGTMLKMYAVGALLSSPKIKAQIGNKMNEGMIAPYKKVLKTNKK
ncbi:MAG: iron-sulfur protein [Lachnospiraceae bacterium]|nr:iron-sulfur protein [Lachnospiraceae bacterium]